MSGRTYAMKLLLLDEMKCATYYYIQICLLLVLCAKKQRGKEGVVVPETQENESRDESS